MDDVYGRLCNGDIARVWVLFGALRLNRISLKDDAYFFRISRREDYYIFFLDFFGAGLGDDVAIFFGALGLDCCAEADFSGDT